MADDKPVIIIKKKGGHGGHHGGAWKIAYADFVTAMMAFFMVMWLVNTSDSPTKKSIASYFRKPGIFNDGSGSPISTGGAGILNDAFVPTRPESKQNNFGKSQDPSPRKSKNKKANEINEPLTSDEPTEGSIMALSNVDEPPPSVEEAKSEAATIEKRDGTSAGNVIVPSDQLTPAPASTIAPPKAPPTPAPESQQMAEKIKEQIQNTKALQELLGIVDVKVDADGLNIEIMDTEKSSMFRRGSAAILPDAQAAFRKLGGIIAQSNNRIDIIGHTDATPFGSRNGGYSNWELSSDRANAARRLLEAEGIPPERITSVTGRADKDLRVVSDPTAAANRRITLKIRFNLPAPALPAPEAQRAVKELPRAERKFQQEYQEKEKVHALTVQQVLKEQAEQGKKKIKIPKEAAPTANPDYMQRDKIFGDSPLIGPRDPFENLGATPTGP
jgi:chemotaxis protein MotB